MAMLRNSRECRKPAAKQLTEFAAQQLSTLAAAEIAPAIAGLESVMSDNGEQTVLVMLHDDVEDRKAIEKSISDAAGKKELVKATKDSSADKVDSDNALYLEKLGIVVLKADAGEIASLCKSAEKKNSDLFLVKPPRPIAPIGDGGLSLEYLTGYRDCLDQLIEKFRRHGMDKGDAVRLAGAQAAAIQSSAGANNTFGLSMTGVINSPFTGEGAKLCVLDSGLDFGHPDFSSRTIKWKNFFTGGSIQDFFGHGTHCTGTACGPANPTGSVRYGIASKAELHVGKVLNDFGKGSTTELYAGMNWAVDEGCHVVSISIGIVRENSPQFVDDMAERIGDRAMTEGCLMIAAAGNRSNRPHAFAQVEGPANCQTVMAVGAIDRTVEMYGGSARSSTDVAIGGAIDLVGPGVAVHSSLPVAQGSYGMMTGTSMATPHVSGIACLWHEQSRSAGGALTGPALASKLKEKCFKLSNTANYNLDPLDVGKGLVQAPLA